MKHSKISEIAFSVFLILFVIVALITSSIIWTHGILLVVQKNQIHIGDPYPYQDNYTVVEITEDRKSAMVVNNTNHVLYDVMLDSSGSTYLMVHLDENGLPTKRTEPVIPETQDSELFDSGFDFAHELKQSIPLLIIQTIGLIVIIFSWLKDNG